MASKSIHLSRLSNQQVVESEARLDFIERVSGKRDADGSYTILTPGDGGMYVTKKLSPEIARKIAEHILATDPEPKPPTIQETDDHDNQ